MQRLTGEPITSASQIQQGDLVRCVCDDGVERIGAIGFMANGEWLLFPAEMLNRPLADLLPKRRAGRPTKVSVP